MNLDDHNFLNMERYILFYSLKKNESEKFKIRQQKETEEKLY